MTCTGALSFPFHSMYPLPVPHLYSGRVVMVSIVLAYSFATSKLEQSANDMLNPGKA